MSETPAPTPNPYSIPDKTEFFKQKALTLEEINTKLIFYRQNWYDLEYIIEAWRKFWYQTETSDEEVKALIDVFNTELEDIALRLKDNIIEDLTSENDRLRERIKE